MNTQQQNQDLNDCGNSPILGGSVNKKEMRLVKYDSDTLDLSIYEKELELLSKIVQKGKSKKKILEIRDRNLVRIQKLQDILDQQKKQLEDLDLELIVLITEKQLLTTD